MILFLNQYFPPDPAPTGILLGELAAELEQAGTPVRLVSAGAAYRSGQGKGGRLRREALALGRILLAGLRAPRARVVLSATSPPCLLLVATLLAKWHRARTVHWAMDLYPELAVSLGEVRPGFATRLLTVLTGWCYRQTDLIVALDRDMADHLERAYGVKAEIVRPWVFASLQPRVAALCAAPPAPSGPWSWIYSGNLGRAHEWETLLAAQREIEQRDGEARLIFQGGGPARSAAQERARELGLRRCEWRDYAPEAEVAESLLHSSACAVTQLPVARGLLWPSKLGLLLSLPRPLAWVGVAEGAIARELRALPQAGVFAPGEDLALARWLLALKAGAAGPVAPSVRAGDERASSLRRWRELLAPMLAR